jgi:hypothetical protein
MCNARQSPACSPNLCVQALTSSVSNADPCYHAWQALAQCLVLCREAQPGTSMAADAEIHVLCAGLSSERWTSVLPSAEPLRTSWQMTRPLSPALFVGAVLQGCVTLDVPHSRGQGGRSIVEYTGGKRASGG